MKVLVLALGGNRQKAAISDAEFVVESGGEVTLLTTQKQKWPEFDPRITVTDLTEAEKRHPVNYLEWLVVFRAPRILARVLPSAGRRAVDQLSWKVHRKLWEKPYRRIRPVVLWWVTRRTVLPALQPSRYDLVLVADPVSIPLAWNLAREHRQLPVSFTLDRAAVQVGNRPDESGSR